MDSFSAIPLKFSRSRFTAWIAILAVLLAALAPGISQAFASSQAQATPWIEICTSAGTQLRLDPAPTGGSGEHEGKLSAHCPFCLNHAGHFGLPATPLEFSLPLDAGAALPRCSFASSGPLHACTSPPSRAPPVFS
ncbi:MAG: DUF2946 domain-containing protein [Betaproteobacteria bacterium]|nr:DUF2946 domain-containing protein [Betaproteobacteria bacterium]